MPDISISALAEMALSLAFAAVCAALFQRDMSLGRRSVDLLGILLLFLGIQSAHVMLAGLCGMLTGRILGTTAALGLAAIFAFPAGRRRVAECWHGLPVPAWRDLRHGLSRHLAFAAVASIAGAYVLLHVAMFVFLQPPLTFDALTYHLSKVAQWVHSGSLYLPDLPIKRVFWPSGMELLNAWWAVFLHHELLIETPGVFFHALAVGAVWVIARNMGLSRHAAGWGALLFALTPAVVVHGSTCLTDLPTAAVFLYLLALWTHPADCVETARRRWLLSAASFCYAIGIKPTIAFMAPGLVLAAVPAWGKNDLRAIPSLFRPPRAALALVVAAALMGGFWYVRNAVRFGNPLYPVVAGTATKDGIQSGAFSLNSLKTALSMLVLEGGILDGSPVIPNLYKMTGWGWTAVACGVPCSILSAIRSRRFRWLFAAQIVAGCVVLAMVRPDFSCLRFLLWIPSVLCIGIVGAIVSGGLPRPLAWILRAVVGWTLVLNFGAGLAHATGLDWLKQLGNVGRRKGGNAAVQARFARFVPAGEDIAVFMDREGFLYLVYGPGFTRSVVTIEAENAPVDFAKALDEAGARFLFYSGWPRNYPRAAKSLRRQMADGLMTDLGVGLFVRGSENPEKAGSP